MPLYIRSTTFKMRLPQTFDGIAFNARDCYRYDAANGWWVHVFHDSLHDQDGDFLLDQNGEKLYA